MSYLLDTNVLSETVRRDPNPAVIAWFDTVPDRALHISVLTLEELRKGVERAPDPRRRERLRNWLEHDLRDWFEDRILPVDHAVADRWGRLMGQTDRPSPLVLCLPDNLGCSGPGRGCRCKARLAGNGEPLPRDATPQMAPSRPARREPPKLSDRQSTSDSLLAATALHFELRIVTRNVRNFDDPELEVVDPWRTPP